MGNNVNLITEITRSATSNEFSLEEIYYRHFSELPQFFFSSGSSGDDDENDGLVEEAENDDNPLKGPEEVEKAVTKFLDVVREANLNLENLTQYEYFDFTAGSFYKILVFGPVIGRTSQMAARIRVRPLRHESYTSIEMITNNKNCPLWKACTAYGLSFVKPIKDRIDEINIIVENNRSYYLKSIPLSVKKRKEFSYEYYNDDFEAVSKHVIESLQQKDDSGLILFHGDPGTGKTSYLKHLLHVIVKKKLIYLPPNLVTHLSEPGFIAFLMSEARNSILLVEDAENILKPREAGFENQSVSNILNISDGILGDVLKIQIVCTFNSRVEDIDQALLRPGRLNASYKFNKLSIEKTNALYRKLYGDDAVLPNEEQTLAKIFNNGKLPARNDVETKIKIGFA